MSAQPRTPVLTRLARLEGFVELRLARLLWRRGWRPLVIAYPGYGEAAGPEDPNHDDTSGWVRVLARVLLAAPDEVPADASDHSGHRLRRGWRHYLSVSLAGVPLDVELAGERHRLVSGREGYLDALLPADLSPGWHPVALRVAGRSTVGRVRVVGAHETAGVVSDIDDTVLITAVPRPLLALWNSFVRHETARRPVPGMAAFLARLTTSTDGGPAPFVCYLSTGAWNAAPALARFLARHGYPEGPLLLTDWGPTETAWFRSGRDHKRAALRRLLDELPGLHWSLVGDDGQHDPLIYDELAEEEPDRVRLVAIRELSGAEQLRTHGSPEPPVDARATAGGRRRSAAAAVRHLRGPDGFALLRQLDGPRTDVPDT